MQKTPAPGHQRNPQGGRGPPRQEDRGVPFCERAGFFSFSTIFGGLLWGCRGAEFAEAEGFGVTDDLGVVDSLGVGFGVDLATDGVLSA